MEGNKQNLENTEKIHAETSDHTESDQRAQNQQIIAADTTQEDSETDITHRNTSSSDNDLVDAQSTDHDDQMIKNSLPSTLLNYARDFSNRLSAGISDIVDRIK